MGLLSTLLNANPSEVEELPIEKIVVLCGDGKLADGTQCSVELREYLSQVKKAEVLRKYLNACLQTPFNNNGYVLQDIVNEFGRRLEYTVENGLYRGKVNAIGFDGIWHDPGSGHHIVVEVKTTDTYGINIDTLSRYRDALIKAGKITEKSSILLVVGREDTGGLEASVLGSGQAKKTRIISADALAKLVFLQEDSDPVTLTKIHDLLVPFELVKLDRIIEIAFSAAEDAKVASKEEQGEALEPPAALEQPQSKKHEMTPPEVIAQLRTSMVDSFEHDHVPLVKKGRALYASAADDKRLRAVFTVSKEYAQASGPSYYWFAYHVGWDKYLGEAEEGFYVLGCVGRNEAYALPVEWIRERTKYLNATEKEERSYFQVYIYAVENGNMLLWLSNHEHEPLDNFKMPLHSVSS